MEKRGQVTVFIVLGIIIVASAGLYFGFKDKLISNEIPIDLEPFYTNFFSCFEQVSNEGIFFVAGHGGYFNPPINQSIIYFDEGFPYYYLESKAYIPSIENVEKEIENYISSNLEDCLNIEGFADDSFEINRENYNVLVTITPEKVNVKLLSSIAVKKGKSTANLKNSEISFDYNIVKLHQTSKEIVEFYSSTPGMICLTCLETISEKNNITIESLPVLDISIYENDIIWFFITDKNDDSEEKLTWGFVVEK